MDQSEEIEDKKIFRAYNTLHHMLRDRGYQITDEKLEMSREAVKGLIVTYTSIEKDTNREKSSQTFGHIQEYYKKKNLAADLQLEMEMAELDINADQAEKNPE